MGFDPTIKRVPRSQLSDDAAFDITLEDPATGRSAIYRTTRIIADYGAEALRGRGTRVWAVYDTKDTLKRPRVLKDVWVNDDRQREDQVLSDIRDGLSGDPEREHLAAHFLTKEMDADVLVDSQHDNTYHLIRGGHKLAVQEYIWAVEPPPKPIRSATLSTTSTGNIPTPQETPPKAEDLLDHQRQHYRVIFTEVGIALADLTNFEDIFTAISGAIHGGYSLRFKQNG